MEQKNTGAGTFTPAKTGKTASSCSSSSMLSSFRCSNLFSCSFCQTLAAVLAVDWLVVSVSPVNVCTNT